jgi:hypothetical protein
MTLSDEMLRGQLTPHEYMLSKTILHRPAKEYPSKRGAKHLIGCNWRQDRVRRPALWRRVLRGLRDAVLVAVALVVLATSTIK